jgi:tartrate dehydrogenase/decarboxylase/D-malate dehydrogenase
MPDHESLWGLRLPICQGFDQYAHVRPMRVLPGVMSPLGKRGKDTDWVIIRENSEGEYAGNGIPRTVKHRCAAAARVAQ